MESNIRSKPILLTFLLLVGCGTILGNPKFSGAKSGPKPSSVVEKPPGFPSEGEGKNGELIFELSSSPNAEAGAVYLRMTGIVLVPVSAGSPDVRITLDAPRDVSLNEVAAGQNFNLLQDRKVQVGDYGQVILVLDETKPAWLVSKSGLNEPLAIRLPDNATRNRVSGPLLSSNVAAGASLSTPVVQVVGAARKKFTFHIDLRSRLVPRTSTDSNASEVYLPEGSAPRYLLENTHPVVNSEGTGSATLVDSATQWKSVCVSRADGAVLPPGNSTNACVDPLVEAGISVFRFPLLRAGAYTVTGTRTVGAGVGTLPGFVVNAGGDTKVTLPNPKILSLDMGDNYGCALFESGQIKCFGSNASGALGLGHGQNIGDDELPASVGFVDLDGPVTQIAAGRNFMCALMSTENVRCWGSNEDGRLGLGNTANVGLTSLPRQAEVLDLGGPVKAITAGDAHACALLASGDVRCWGRNGQGQLGLGHTRAIGDDEKPSTAPVVNLGEKVVQISAGHQHTCAILASGSLRCWGAGASGQLGLGNANPVGETNSPSSVPTVNVGGSIASIHAAEHQTCALLLDGTVRCWGLAIRGKLGYGNTTNIGDNELPVSAGPVPIGMEAARQLAVRDSHACAVTNSDKVVCWGMGTAGALGYASTENVGDDETPQSAGFVDVGQPVKRIFLGHANTCALLESGNVRCWGQGSLGALGTGATGNVGDTGTPAATGKDISFFR